MGIIDNNTNISDYSCQSSQRIEQLKLQGVQDHLTLELGSEKTTALKERTRLLRRGYLIRLAVYQRRKWMRNSTATLNIESKYKRWARRRSKIIYWMIEIIIGCLKSTEEQACYLLWRKMNNKYSQREFNPWGTARKTQDHHWRWLKLMPIRRLWQKMTLIQSKRKRKVKKKEIMNDFSI